MWVYLLLIRDRLKKEYGGKDDEVDPELLDILNLIEKVKQEKRHG